MDAVRSQEIECAQCKKTFTVTVPEPDFINAMSVSMIVWPHPDPQDCPFCGLSYVFGITGIQGAQQAWIPVEKKKQQSRIVAPPPGLVV